MAEVLTFNLSDNFISRLADYTQERFINKGISPERCAFVFGGKRPALFLKREMSLRLKKEYFPPRFYSIEEFIEDIVCRKVNFRKITELDACFKIYSITKELRPGLLKGREAFAEFLPWAREILSFIEQVDLEDIALEALKDVQANARIGYDVPKEVNLMLADIVAIRHRFHQALFEAKTYSRGLLYLRASEIIQEIDFKEFEEIVFAGFFYLHNTEKEIIRRLYQKDKATLIFQGDEDEWDILKQLGQSLSCRIKPLAEDKKENSVSFYRGFDTHSQASIARGVLKKINGLNNSVVVLPDSGALIPLLSQVTSLTEEINVSLGYPLKRSSLYSLFEIIFRCQVGKKKQGYYTRDYLKALRHPFIKNLKVFEPQGTRVLVHKIEEVLTGIVETNLAGSLFINLEDIENLRVLREKTQETLSNMGIAADFGEISSTLKELHKLCFTSWQGLTSFKDFSGAAGKFVKTLVEKSFMQSYPPNLKVAERVISILEELKSADFSSERLPEEEIFKVFLENIESEMLSFTGSPLKGLQVLGLFETRLLNFEHVVIMDVNESVLPKLRVYEPLIPRDVMVSLGINRLEKEEEIQRYQFMRLISSAKTAHLIYEENKEYERSRFIEELLWKKEQKLGALDSDIPPLSSFSVNVMPKTARARKSEAMAEFLKRKEFSASSINTYMHCPLKFYYRYILGLEEKEDLLEEPEATDIGVFVHGVLEKTYKMFVGRRPEFDQRFKEYFSKEFERMFDEYFMHKMKSDSFMLKNILEFRLNKFIEQEENRQDIEKIISLENDFRAKIKLEKNEFNFICRVDRIEKLNDASTLIIDYKTGSGVALPRAISKLEKLEFSRIEIKKNIRSFQLPLYLYCIGNEFKDSPVNAAFYSLRSAEITPFPGKKEIANKQAVFEICMEALQFILKEIIDPKIEFVADEENPRLCNNCPFFYLCR